MRRYLLDRDADALKDAAMRIKTKPATERHEITKRDSNAQTVRAFAENCHEITFDKLVPSKGPQQGCWRFTG